VLRAKLETPLRLKEGKEGTDRKVRGKKKKTHG
jgi:hypothetical protein